MTYIVGDAGHIAEHNRLLFARTRLTSATITSDSAGLTTVETVVMSLPSATYLAGKTYRFEFSGHGHSTIAADALESRIRKTNAAGTIIALSDLIVTSTAKANWHFAREYTVGGSDETMVVVMTLFRDTGTGTVNLSAAASNPAFFTVDRVL